MKKNMTNTSANSSASDKVYQIVTDRIIARLEAGNIPWVKSFYHVYPAFNRVSGKIYSGVNRVLLEKDGEYATFKQWQELGGKVKKGEKSEIIISWAKIEKEYATKNADGEIETKTEVILRPRYYNVFHISQVEGVEPLKESDYPKLNAQDIDDAEDLLKFYWNREGIKVEELEANKAFYSPYEDRIQLRSRKQYTSMPMFYRVAFHESVHSTGHSSRLDRLSNNAAFGSEVYSKEELTAELGSAFIMAMLGLETEDTETYNAKYIESWLEVLRNDNRMIVQAAARAEKAVEFILKGYKPTGSDDDDNTEEAPAASPEMSKAKKNVIPRNATKMLVAFNDDQHEQMLVTRDAEGFHGLTQSGKCYSVFASHLRNGNLCSLEVLDPDVNYPVGAVNGWLHFDLEDGVLYVKHVDDNAYDAEYVELSNGRETYYGINRYDRDTLEDAYEVILPFDRTYWTIPGQMSFEF